MRDHVHTHTKQPKPILSAKGLQSAIHWIHYAATKGISSNGIVVLLSARFVAQAFIAWMLRSWNRIPFTAWIFVLLYVLCCPV
jgi:hypothetical protein